ncbi:MAG: hypothetical protein UT23_C0004G0157 [Candidatus Woesebacteria bacterium GW2011_GWA1_39_12]|uniref:Class I SAM-dependent methyltransferase n=2 Tax=Candidatus Woeseibacteriota TaxID=1752722 RepID=A0A0G0Q9E7_9BACT|nr:MAG: hypothetical protein UT23_C0004G0157 [Candidatus Woesebacteria bacterium GW2011_GWA1_39_12]
MEGGEYMNPTLDYVIKKFNIDTNQPSLINISFSRYGMIDIFRELNFITGAEIGTEHGTYAEKLCRANPNLKLYCIDPWTSLPYYEGSKKQEEVDTFYEAAKGRLASYNCEILKMTSMEAVKRFKPNSLDFVFIDGNHHFEFVVNDVIHWSRRVRPGGIVYGHDYSDQFHVREAVNAFMAASKIKPWFILHKSGLIDSWMYVRQETDQIHYDNA